jgi:hypothetical protein
MELSTPEGPSRDINDEDDKYKLWSYPFRYFVFLSGPRIFLSELFSKHTQCFPLRVKLYASLKISCDATVECYNTTFVVISWSA